jgi:NTE family protein
LRADTGRELFVCATRVRTGEPRVFTRPEISAEVVMASACLPLLFRAVEIDGESYWDGGYSSNPALIPFIRATDAEDLLIVQVSPRMRERVPESVSDIASRANEMTGNAALLAELRAIALTNQLIDQGRLRWGRGRGDCRRIRVHRIALTDQTRLTAGSRLNNNYDFFQRLNGLGRRAAREFLAAHFDDIGRRSTIDTAVPTAAEVA